MVFSLCVPAWAEPVVQAHTRVDLLLEQEAVQPGETLWAGFHLVLDPEWHVYWRNPGDSGLPPAARWQVPSGVTVGDFAWPVPERINAGPLTAFGYPGEVLLMAPVTVGKNVPAGPLTLSAHLEWLACREGCIPGRADLTVTVPVLANTSDIPQDSPSKNLFDQTRRHFPVVLPSLKAEVWREGADWVFRLRPETAHDGEITFFPYRDDVIDHAAAQTVTRRDGAYLVRVPKSTLLTQPAETLEGVWVHSGGWDAAGKVTAVTLSVPVTAAPAGGTASPLTWGLACLFALIGGLLLNLMPCVLPVLSLKILQIIRHQDDRRAAARHAFFFAAGVTSAFWVLAAVLMALKAAGQAAGWGFQFQSPVFVYGITVLLFVFALNLLGVFEITVAVSARPSTGQGHGAAFMSGVFTTMVATPCTAPFMGTALGFALAQPPLLGLTVFTCLALGMAAPVVILTLSPRLLAFVPKPGPWMTGLKAVLGFLLLACVIWLLGVLGAQTGLGPVVTVLSVLLLVSVGLWLAGQGRRRPGLLLAVGVLVWGAGAIQPRAEGIAWRPFSATAVEQARRSGDGVFIDFTAAWCLSCQANDRLVLQSAPVVKAFRDQRIIAFKADWTSHDETITRALAAYGRDSIPLYVYYPPGGETPVVLPEVITPGLVLDAIQQQTVHP